MAKLRLSRLAQRDLDEVRAYSLAWFGIDATIAHLEAIERIFTLLQTHPLAGQEQPLYGDGIRTFVVRPHRILYRADTDALLIVRVLHTARSVPPTMLAG